MTAVYPDVQILREEDDKVYIDNLKVMTAQNYTTSIKLTDKLSKELGINQPPINWWASEKWDGIRALWDGEKIISRGSGLTKPKVYTYVPEWFINILPPGIALDGEIWIGRGLFQKTSRLSTIKPGKSYTQEEIEDIWSGKEDNPVVFKAFDIPGNKEPFEKRMELLKNVIDDRKKLWKESRTFPLQFTEQVKIESEEQIVDMYNDLTKNGAEGLMLRASNSPYEAKRSKYMLKYKIKEDSECIVREYTIGEGRLKGLLGSLNCEMLSDGKPNGVFTQIGTGFTDSQRQNYNNSSSKEYIPIGSIISFSFMEMTKDGVPRHPVYRGIRDDIGLRDTISVKEVKQGLTFLMNKIINNKEPNWGFKIKYYKQAIEILRDDMKLNKTEDYLKVLRENGMILSNEEATKEKTGKWKSTILQNIDHIIKNGPIVNKQTEAIENFTKIANIGPSCAARIFKEEEITTVEELKEVYRINPNIINEKQALGLLHHDDLQKRIPRQEMNLWNEIMSKNFQDGKLIISGSYRRGNKDSGDVDVLITTETYNKDTMDKFYNKLVEKCIIEPKNIISKGPTKIMTIAKIKDTYRHVDIFYYTKDVYPFALLFTTGSKEFNVKMRAHALKKGYSLNERNLTHSSISGKPVSKEEYVSKICKEIPETEEDIFKFLDYPYIFPEKR